MAEHFIKKFNVEIKKSIETISPEARELLIQYNYPGNVRELENIIERAMILQDGSTLEADTLSICFPEKNPLQYFNFVDMEFQDAKSCFEKEYIKNLLLKMNHNISQAAKMAGMDRKNFKDKMKKYEIYNVNHKFDSED